VPAAIAVRFAALRRAGSPALLQLAPLTTYLDRAAKPRSSEGIRSLAGRHVLAADQRSTALSAISLVPPLADFAGLL
jgi:hypothetical protein